MKKRFISLVLAIMMIFTMMAEAFPNAAVAASSAKYATISSMSNAKNGVSLKWNTVSGATKYAIYYKHGDSKWIQDSTTTDVAAVATHASESGETYYFKIKSYMKSTKKWVDGKQSSGIMFIAAPEVTISGNTANGVTLKWDKISVATKYRVYYKLSGAAKYTTYKDVTSPAVTITGLTQWGKYVFAVKAFNGSSYSGYIPTDTLCVGANPVVTAENTATGIKLTWAKVTGATKYRVYYKYGETTYERVKDVTDLTYTFTGLTDGTKYTFAVKAYNSTKKIWSSHKAVSLVRYSSVPIIRGATSVTTGGFEVSWTTATNATKYRLYYKVKGTSSWTKTDVTKVTKTLTGLTYGETYTFAVRAYNGTDKVWGAVSNSKSYKYTKPSQEDDGNTTENKTTIKFDPEVIEKIMAGYKFLGVKEDEDKDEYQNYCAYSRSLQKAADIVGCDINNLKNKTSSQLAENGLWKDSNGAYFQYDSEFYDNITDYKSRLKNGGNMLLAYKSMFVDGAVSNDYDPEKVNVTFPYDLETLKDEDGIINLDQDLLDEIKDQFEAYATLFNINGIQCESTKTSLNNEVISKNNWSKGHTNSVACSGHVFENIICIMPQTCFIGETYMCICTKCGYITEKGGEAQEHDYSIFIGNYGVCCENGYWAKYQCSICGFQDDFRLAPVQNCQKVWSDNGHMACNVCTCSVCGTQYGCRLGDGSEKDMIAATQKVVDLLNDYTYARIQKQIDNGVTVIEKDLGNGRKEWVANYGTINEVDYLQAYLDEETIWALSDVLDYEQKQRYDGNLSYEPEIGHGCWYTEENFGKQTIKDLAGFDNFSELLDAGVSFRYWGCYWKFYDGAEVRDGIPVYIGVVPNNPKKDSYNNIYIMFDAYGSPHLSEDERWSNTERLQN